MDEQINVHTVVIGAGISGLTAAYSLYKKNVPFVVLECSDRVGGVIDSPKLKEFNIERAAASIRLNKEVEQLIEQLGIKDKVIRSNQRSKRYILKDDRLHEVTTHPKMIFSTPLLSLAGKLRVFLELFIAKGKVDDESVHQFFCRRFGKQVLDNFITPMVSGIYAGDPQKMSMKSSFPQIYQMEQEYGSIIKAFMNNKNKSRSKAQFITFKKGISFLADSIAKLFSDKIYLKYRISNIEKHLKGYKIEGDYLGGYFSIITENIICTIPAYAFKGLFDNIDSQIQRLMDKINYPSLALLHLGYREDQSFKDAGAFGFLVAQKENKSFLGAVFNANMFRENINYPKRLYTLFIGGDKEQFKNLEHLILEAEREFEKVMRIQQPPIFKEVTFYQNAIPQFYLGYQQVKQQIENIQNQNKGLFFSGSYMSGISLGDCIVE